MKRAAWVVGVAALLLACVAGWVASTAPDGLERVAESLGFASRGRAVAPSSPFADYQTRWVPAGLVGVVLLYGFGVLFGRTLKRKK